MRYLSYGVGKVRVTLYDLDGVTPMYRVTFQRETNKQFLLEFKPEGIQRMLGSGAGWANVRVHRGWRPSVAIKWSHGLLSGMERWGLLTSSWGPLAEVKTTDALNLVLSKGMVTPCLVEPRLDDSYSFKAQPDGSKSYALRDVKNLLHIDLELSLIGVILEAQIFPQATVPVPGGGGGAETPGDYVAPGYVDTDYVTGPA